MKKQSIKPSNKLSERANRLKDLLEMMENEPQKFAHEALCDPRLLNKLLPEACDQAIATDPSPRKRTRMTLRFKVLEYIANAVYTQDHKYQNAILGALFLWEMYLDRLEIGQYRSIELEGVVDFWCKKDSLIDFMNGPLRQYLERDQKKEFFRSFQEFNIPGNGISALFDRLQPNTVQSRASQNRTFTNYLNRTVERLASEIESASLEILGFSALAMAEVDPPEIVLPIPDILPRLREVVRRTCKDPARLYDMSMDYKYAIFRTFNINLDPLSSMRIESAELFRKTSGVIISPRHSGKTTYVKMLALKTAEADTDYVAIYINAVDLKTFAQLKFSVYEFLADQLSKQGLAGEDDFEMDVAALKHADRIGKIIFFIDAPEALAPEQESAVILQFSLCRQVFFVTTPWGESVVRGLMTEYNPGREVRTYSLQKLSPAEKDELVNSLDQQYPGFQEAAKQFLAHTYSNLFEQPIGLVTLAAEYLRTGGYLSELFIAQRIFNILLIEAGLKSYQITFTGLSRRNYRLGWLSGILANQNTAEYKRVAPGEDSRLFWPLYTLDNFFGLRNPACDPFARSFLEPESNDPRMVRFFFRDLHYLLVAINNVLPYLQEDRFIGSPKDLENSFTPLERRSPNLDPNSIVRLYQMDLLAYLMYRQAEVGLKWKL
jgi:hypothetical protein